MNFTLKIWRQKNRTDKGKLVTYTVSNIPPDASFLEMLDVLNASLVRRNEEPVAFDHDCREGICGSCGLMIEGRAHGPKRRAATCELRMRSFPDGDTITVEPWRARPFPVIKDLVVDRKAFDRIMQAGGYVSVTVLKGITGSDDHAALDDSGDSLIRILEREASSAT